MKKIIKHFVFCFAVFLCCSKQSNAQAKLVLNGGIINITNACNIVLENDSSNAIIRYDGNIISEGEENIIMWHIKETVGTYTIPFGTATGEYIPVCFEKSTGVGNGHFNFSTYPTGWQNTDMLPQGVTHLINPGFDNSDVVIDRFWQIDARAYVTKPAVNNLKLTYSSQEHTDTNNTIIESNLSAIRWNSKKNTWNDYQPMGQIDSISNTFSVTAVADSNMYKWWTLLSKNGVANLPVKLIDFTAGCENGKTKLNWITGSEQNNQFFALENSKNGFDWIELTRVGGANTTNFQKEYSYTHDSITDQLNYFRLKQTDINGKYTYSEIIKNTCEIKEENLLSVYPNPSNGFFYVNKDLAGKMLTVQNANGQVVVVQNFLEKNRQINLGELTDGVYVLNVDGETKKVIIKK